MIHLKVNGMSCTHCQASVEKALKDVPGVTDVDVSLEDGTVSVQGNPAREAVVKAIEAAGYTAEQGGANG